MNKKGSTATDAVVDLVSYSVFILIMVAFFYLFKLSSDARTNQLNMTEFAEVDGQYFLINYLQKPMTLEEGRTVSLADYIVMQYEKEKTLQPLKSIFEKDFLEYQNSLGIDCASIHVSTIIPKTLLGTRQSPDYVWYSLPPKYIKQGYAESYCANPTFNYAIKLPRENGELIYVKLGVSQVNVN